LAVETVKGALFGTLFAPLGAFIRPKPSLKVTLPSGVAAPTEGLTKFKNIPDMLQNLNIGRKKSVEVAKNEIGFSKFASEYAQLIEHPDGTLIDAQTQTLDDRIKRDFMEQYAASIYNDGKRYNSFFRTGAEDFETAWQEAKVAEAVGAKYGEAGRPIKKAIDNIYDPTIEGAQRDLISVRKLTGEVEKEFDPAILNQTFPQNNQYKLAADSVVGNTSFLTKNLVEWDAKIADVKVSAESKRYIDSLTPNFLQDLGTDLRAAAEQSGMVKKGTPTRLLPALGGKIPLVKSATPEQIYKFLQKADKYIGETYDKAKSYKLLKQGTYNEEARVFSLLKKELEVLGRNFVNLAPNQEAITKSIAKMNSADETLRTVLKVGKLQKTKVVKGGKLAENQGVERGLIARSAFDKYGAFNDSTGGSALKELRPTIENYFDTLASEFKTVGELTGRDMTAYIERMNANKKLAIEAMNDRDAISWKSLERWYKWQDKVNALETTKMTGRGLPSNRVRLNRIAHDLATQNISAAGRQTTALITDNIIGWFNKQNTPQTDFIRLQIEEMSRLKQMGDRGEQITQGFVSRVIKGIPAGKGAPSKLLSILPYQMRKLSSDDRTKIDSDFRKVSEKLYDFTSNPETIFNTLQTTRVLNDLSAGAGDALSNKMLGTFTKLYSLIPKGPPESQGGGPPPLMQRAKFLDLVTAVTDPYRVVELMEFGAVTQEMVDAMRESAPQIYNKIATKIAYELYNNPDISLKARTKFQSLFPMLNATVRPVPGAQPYSSITPPAQEMGDQNSSAMGKIRISGPNKLDANKQLGTFTTQGAP
jgi:hypothetical protein